jgi:hypothetical protein
MLFSLLLHRLEDLEAAGHSLEAYEIELLAQMVPRWSRYLEGGTGHEWQTWLRHNASRIARGGSGALIAQCRSADARTVPARELRAWHHARDARRDGSVVDPGTLARIELPERVDEICLSPEGGQLAIACRSSLFLAETRRYTLRRWLPIEYCPDSYRRLAWNPVIPTDLAANTKLRDVSVYDLASGAHTAEIATRSHIHDVAFAEGRLVAANGDGVYLGATAVTPHRHSLDATCSGFPLASEQLDPELELPGCAASIAVAPGERAILIGQSRGKVSWVDPASASVLGTWSAAPDHKDAWVTCVAIHPDGEHVFTACAGEVARWRRADAAPVLTTAVTGASDFALDPSGRWIAISADRQLHIADATTGACSDTFPGLRPRFHPDGRLFHIEAGTNFYYPNESAVRVRPCRREGAQRGRPDR